MLLARLGLLRATARLQHAAPLKRRITSPSARTPRAAPSRAMAAAAPLRFSVDVSVDVEGVIKAARDAAAVILSIYEGEASAWEMEQKADSSPLTRADREANTLICGAPFEPLGAQALWVRDATLRRRDVQRAWRSWRRTCRS
jgi:hypothetical protein